MHVRKRCKLGLFTLIGETGIQYIFRQMIKPKEHEISQAAELSPRQPFTCLTSTRG